MKRKAKNQEEEVEFRDRSSFTPGWNDSTEYDYGLPIIEGGKIIPVKRAKKVVHEEVANLEEPVQSEEKNANDLDEKDNEQASSKEEGVDKFSNDDIMNMDVDSVKITLARICSDITSDPERSVRKHKKNTIRQYFVMNDLFQFLACERNEVKELAIVSATIVFMDILPGYRIRQWNKKDEKDVTLKKETQKIKDFEVSLLSTYQRFLELTNKSVENGLGNAKRKPNKESSSYDIAMAALRCQCELIRKLYHFNFRSILLLSIVTRAAQNCPEVSQICCDTIQTLLQVDNVGEMSFEIVRMISRTATSFDFNVPCQFIECLQFVKLTVHADEATSIRKKLKAERKKRRKAQDEVTSGLLEASSITDVNVKKRFQVDCLEDICLTFFRIIKNKVGFALLPVAVEGLSNISHLVNIDLIDELMIILKELIEKSSSVPLVVRCLCLQCAFRTLFGPGQELKMDHDPFLLGLLQCLSETNHAFSRWDVLLDCLDYALLRRRESRNSIIRNLLYMLLQTGCQLEGEAGVQALSVAQAIMLRYPTVRLSLAVFANTVADQEIEEVGDLAMKALRQNKASELDRMRSEDVSDSSWVLLLLKNHLDANFHKVISAMLSREIIPLPFRVLAAKSNEKDLIEAMDQAFQRARVFASKVPKSARDGGVSGAKSSNSVLQSLGLNIVK